MPQQPQRILEKSRTVRRRYQRSDKRFEFTASQIERIEREQERERRAQKLQEQEKKRKANKKKKAEKEAKAREERKRLGLPDPNVSRVPASQPLLSNFFGRDPLSRSSKQELDGDTIVNSEPGQSASNNEVCVIPSENSPGTENIPIKSTEKVNEYKESKQIENSQRTPHESITRLLQSPRESFDNDTLVLPEELCDDTLDEDANDKDRTKNTKTIYNAHLAREIFNSQDQPPKVSPLLKSPVSEVPSDIQRNMSPDTTTLKTPNNNNRIKDNASGQDSSPILINIYQDPKDVLAGISTQDLADDNDEFDDNKENIHPNILHGQKSPTNASACQSKCLRKIGSHARREPLLPVDINDNNNVDSLFKGQRTLSPAGKTTTKTAATVIPSDDEFDELDLTMEELQELGARCSSLGYTTLNA